MSQNLGADELRARCILRQHGTHPNACALLAPADKATQQAPPIGADELRVRAYLCRMGVVL